MKLGKFAWLLTLAAPVVLTACSEDPTNEGAGDAFAIVTSFSSTRQSAGAAFTVTARVIDRAGTSLPVTVAATSAKADVVAVDSSVYVRELQETRFYLRTLKIDASAPVVISASALTDTVEIKVLSGSFPGTLATAAFSGGTVIEFTSPTDLFDSNTTAELTTSEPGYLVEVTPRRLRYLLPFSQPGGAIPYVISDAGPADFILSGSYNLAQPVPCPDSYEPNNTRAAANTTALAVGTPVFGSGNLNTDSDDYYRFTVTEAGNYRIQLDWSDDTDADLLPRNAAGALISASGATASKPEVVSVALTPGDYYAQVNMYDDAGGACTTYRLTVTKL